MSEQEPLSKAKRGVFKRAVTKAVGKLQYAIDDPRLEVSKVHDLYRLAVDALAAFKAYHDLLHPTLPVEEQPASLEYFNDAVGEYEEILEEAQTYIANAEELERQENEERLRSQQRSLADRDDPEKAQEGDGSSTEHPRTSEEPLQNDTLEQRMTRLEDKLVSFSRIEDLLERTLSAQQCSTPARHPSDDHHSRRPRVSFGGVSRIDPSLRDEDQHSSGADLTRSAGISMMQDMAKSLIDAVKTTVETAVPGGRDHTFKLPKYKLFHFTGKAIDYWPFIKTFDTQVVPKVKDPSTLLSILIEHTSGDLKDALKCCSISNDAQQAYEEARRKMDDTYGQQDVVYQAWLDRFTQLAPIRSVQALSQLNLLLSNCQATLGAVNQLPEFEVKSNLAMIVNKLPPNLRERWQIWAVDVQEAQGRRAGLADLIKFVTRIYKEKADVNYGGVLEYQGDEKKPKTANKEKRANAVLNNATVNLNDSNLENVVNAEKSSNQQINVTQSNAQSQGSRPPKVKGAGKVFRCDYCQGDHMLYRCDQFKGMTVDQRIQAVETLGVCRNCFHPKHRVKGCTSEHRCVRCAGKHHTMIHPEGPPVQLPNAESAPDPSEGGGVVAAAMSKGKVALPVVPVVVYGKGGKKVYTYALIDSGSTCTLTTDRIVDALGIDWVPHVSTITTIDSQKASVTCRLTNLMVQGVSGGRVLKIGGVMSRKTLNLTVTCAATPLDIRTWDHLKDLPIPMVDTDDVEILIGQDCPEVFEQNATRHSSSKSAPYAVLSPLGWYVSGPIGTRGDDIVSCAVLTDDEDLAKKVEKFWAVDDISCCGKPPISGADEKVLRKWERETTHDGERYTVPIPFKEEDPNLPNNRRLAERKLLWLGKRFIRNPEIKAPYVKQIRDTMENYAEKVKPTDPVKKGKVNYLPHHPVNHPRKPGEVRSVKDPSAKWMGTCLNDVVHSGPDLINRLVDILLRIRLDRFVIMGDVKRMFYQILAKVEDRDCMRWLWWEGDEPGGKIVEYRMKCHVFGGVWSPSIANFILKRIVKDFGHEFDAETRDMIEREFYVDDGMKAVGSVDKGIQLLTEVRDLLSRGGMKFTKMFSNSEEIMKGLPPENLIPDAFRKLEVDEVLFLLGCGWKPRTDVLVYRIDVQEKPATKRGILGTFSSYYDPLGLISPLIILAKSIFQECCRRGLAWDDVLPADLDAKWNDWRANIAKLMELEVQRCVLPGELKLTDEGLQFELNVCSDSSEAAYGAAAYLVIIREEHPIAANLLIAKGRVAPIKKLTIPKLELTAAHMAVELEVYLRSTLDLELEESQFHTDSTIVLCAFQNEEKRYLTFFANRLSYMREHTKRRQWHHIPTALNPADLLSRGLSAEELKGNYMWYHGPTFFLQQKKHWPEQPAQVRPSEEVLKDVLKKSEYVLMAKETVERERAEATQTLNKLAESYSTWFRLKKALVYLFKLDRYRRGHGSSLMTTLQELAAAGHGILKQVQRDYFSVPTNVKRAQKLLPFQKDGLIHVAGRLGNAPLHPDQRQPAYLPRGRVADIIIWEFHQRTGHGGVDRVLHALQENYWLDKARQQIKRVLRTCCKCNKHRGKPLRPLMADLPASRVTGEESPFNRSGVDYFGPFLIKCGRKEHKRYGCIFTCMQTRAVHLELAWSLDLDSCINAIVRFSSRRGYPEELTSDNGTNFVGARQELEAAIKEWNSDKLNGFMIRNGIRWKFNPPAAYHMGGVWERQIRSVRSILLELLNDQKLTEESLQTYFCVVENIINGRPLTTVTEDPLDLRPLTPNHLLRLNTRVQLPLGLFTQKDVYRRRWRQIQFMACLFWKRWLGEYLPTLQIRHKWIHADGNLHKDDVVVLTDEYAPRNLWNLARVVRTYPDSKGVVRVVDVFTKRGLLRRPVHKLVLVESSRAT